MIGRSLIFLGVLALWSCANPDSRYFVGADTYWFQPDNYIIGERMGDSIRLQYVTDDNWACACFWSRDPETLPLKPVVGNAFEIVQVGPASIVVKSLGYLSHEFTLKRGQEKRYHLLRNEATRIELEAQYEDSVGRIRQTTITTHNFLSRYTGTLEHQSEEKKMIRNLTSEVFARDYKACLDSLLPSEKREAMEKKRNYDALIGGNIRVDSVYVQKLVWEYDYGHYDRQRLYLVLTRHPELYYTVNYKVLERYLDCKTSFTTDELRAMYCAIKPWEHLSRSRNTLWAFEHCTNFHCESP
ncbi:hypothetical protein [Chryseolinea soli]|nr:hypothetical protein [Chryseolinea soli]